MELGPELENKINLFSKDTIMLYPLPVFLFVFG
jgi:hypothetical protein